MVSARAALRSALTALGIAIGIAAMVAVLGIAESSRATLLAGSTRLGTNLLGRARPVVLRGGRQRCPTMRSR